MTKGSCDFWFKILGIPRPPDRTHDKVLKAMITAYLENEAKLPTPESVVKKDAVAEALAGLSLDEAAKLNRAKLAPYYEKVQPLVRGIPPFSRKVSTKEIKKTLMDLLKCNDMFHCLLILQSRLTK
jgi:hypothetical protein